MILRFYEWAGITSDVKLHVPDGVQSATETNLMEKGIADLPLTNATVTVPTKPYEIKTVKLRFSSAAPVEIIREAK